MITILTDSNNDIHLNGSDSLAMATGIDAVKASCEYAVKTMMGELIYQGDLGVPNFNLIWNGNPNIPQGENAIRETLLRVENVTGVSSIEAFVEGDIFKYNAVINTIFGEVTLGL
jgi:hypothetical protein